MQRSKIFKWKKLFLFLVMFLSACAYPRINYLYKKNIGFSVNDMKTNPEIGIALFGDAIPGLQEVIIQDIEQYTGEKLSFNDLTDKLLLTVDRMNIANIESVRTDYPRIRYIIIVWQDKPLISHHHSKITEEKEEPYYPYKKREEEYELYSTYYTVKSEIILFDLAKIELLAKSANNFHQVAAYKEKDVFPNHTFFGTVEDILDAGDPGDEESKKFPLIKKVDPNIAKGYFFRFLKEFE